MHAIIDTEMNKLIANDSIESPPERSEIYQQSRFAKRILADTPGGYFKEIYCVSVARRGLLHENS